MFANGNTVNACHKKAEEGTFICHTHTHTQAHSSALPDVSSKKVLDTHSIAKVILDPAQSHQCSHSKFLSLSSPRLLTCDRSSLKARSSL